MYELTKHAPGSDFWSQTFFAAIAAKTLKDESDHVGAEFQSMMDNHLKAAAKKRRAADSNPTDLLKRVRQLERELQVERGKCAPLSPSSSSETLSSPSPLDALKDLVLRLKSNCNNKRFPQECLAALPELSRLIDATSSPRRSFGLPLSSAGGKNLVRCLYLAALAKGSNSPSKGALRSWFGWVDANRRTHPILKEINMATWQGPEAL
jgi:hypothetical protein